MFGSQRNNSRYLQQINKGGIDSFFIKKQLQEKGEDIQNINLISQIKQKQNQFQISPSKQKINEDFEEFDREIRSIKSKAFNSSKWDTFAPYSFNKLSSQEKDHIFQSLFQDFKKMKLEHNQYVQKYLKLSAKFHRLESQTLKMRKKGNLTAAEKISVYKQQNEQNRQMKQQIKRLHQKIMALTTNKPFASKGKTKPKNTTFSHTQKSIFPVNQNIKAELELEKKHVRQLLQVIDDLKSNKLNLQAELKQRNLNKRIENISTQGQRKRIGKSSIDNESKFKEYADELLMWKQKYQEMELCYNRMTQDKDNVITQLNQQLIQLRQSERMKKNLQRVNKTNFQSFGQEERIRQLEDMNDRLQRQLKDLARNPLFKDNTQSLQLKKKNTDLQSALVKTKQQIQSLKQMNSKYLAELQYKTKQATMLKSQNQKVKKQLKENIEKDIKSNNAKNNEIYKYDENDYYRKLLHLVKLEGEDPVWKKYADLSAPAFAVMSQTQLRQMAEKLWQNKLELMAHLEKAQIQLKTNKQTYDSRINIYIRQKQVLEQELRIARARVDEWMSMDRIHGAKRDFQVYQSKGLKYNDSISVFEDDQDQIKTLDHSQNFFDLYLGHLNLDEGNVLRHPQNKIKTVSNIISFLTIDFYNHPTQHSNFSEGLSKKLLNNFSFKVEVNPYFIKFLTKNSISIQLWSPQGSSTVLFGKGQIWLRDLMNPTAKDVSNVLRGKCPIYSSGKSLIATIQYRIRMRLPISPFLQWAHTKDSIGKLTHTDPFSINQHKKLAITIERAQELRSAGNTFVYFNLQNQDFFTEPQMGSSPFWDFHRQIDVVLDEDFTSYLKQNFIQFTLFDDDKQVNEDVIGVAKANLTSLLDSKQMLDMVLDIQNNNYQTVGKLKVKINWV